MTARLDETRLAECLNRIRSARTWPGGLVDRLEALVRIEDEFAGYRVNPVAFAAASGVDAADGIALFLVAAKHGLFAMHWDLLCTGCGDLVERFDSLSFMHSSYHCGICQTDYQATLEDSIEVSFTLSPAVRDLLANHPEKLSPEDFYYRWLFNPGGLVPDGRTYVEFIRGYVKTLAHVPSGAVVRAAFAVEPGVLTGLDGLSKTGFWVEVKGEPAKSPQPLAFTFTEGSWAASLAELRPGPVELQLLNPGATPASAFLFCAPPGIPHHPTRYAPFLSAKRLFSNQVFRELFRGELLGGTEHLAARDLTFVFTDLTGSTALYERTGDVKAFALVHQHFDTLTGIVARQGGAIVKTIGDAVMATFSEPRDAVAAAAAMLEDIRAFNRSRDAEDLILKIGVHRGPCIAVTLNDRLDYFGQTVNLAARIQGLAGPEEIVVSAEVMDSDGVAPIAAAFRSARESVAVKGLTAPVAVHRLSAPG